MAFFWVNLQQLSCLFQQRDFFLAEWCTRCSVASPQFEEQMERV